MDFRPDEDPILYTNKRDKGELLQIYSDPPGSDELGVIFTLMVSV